ncbi:hypothetical protein [Micromonospora zhanjiangensis]
MPAPPKKSGAGKVVLIVLAVVLLLCAGGGTTAYFVLRDDAAAVDAAANTRVVEPEKLGSRPKVTEARLKEAADAMAAGIKSSVPSANSAVGAFYGNPADKDLVMIAAAAAPVADEAKEIDNAVTGMRNAKLVIGTMSTVDPGPLGGTAKCGDAKVELSIKVGICIWADKGSLGVVAIYYRSADQTQAEFNQIRAQVEQRS